MQAIAARIHSILQRLPGPGKLIFGGLTEDFAAFRALAACLLAIAGTYLAPPVINLGSPQVGQGLRTLGDDTALLVAAGYLLLAILTLVGGATGDIVGRKRFLLVCLVGVVLANVGAMLLVDTPQYALADTLFKIAQTGIGPMSVAIATMVFAPQIRPFAYGLIFGTQGLVIAAAPGLYSLLKQIGGGHFAFVPAIALGVLACWLIWRDVHEVRTGEIVSVSELVANLLWAVAIFGAIFGLITFQGGLTNENAALAIAVGLLGLVIGYRWIYRRLRKRGEIKLHDVRNLSFAILAGLVLAMAQGTLIYQMWPFYEKVQGVGPIAAGLRMAPFILGMLVGTTIIVRLAMRFDARQLIAGGMVTMAVSLAPFYFLQPDTRYLWLIVPLAVMGLGFGIAGPARTVVVLSAQPPPMIGLGAAVNAASGQLGYALGVIMSSLFVTSMANTSIQAQLRQNGADSALIAQINAAWDSLFAKAMSGDLSSLPPNVAQAITAYFADSFTTGLGQMLLLLALVLTGTAVVIYLGMHKGLRGSFMTPIAQGPTSPSRHGRK
jgi:MFS family permease